LIASQN